MEFALVLPLFLLLLIGMVDFGRAFTYWIDTTHLANEAARFAAVNKKPASCGSGCNLQTYVKNQARAPEADVKIYLLGPDADKGKVGEALCVVVKSGTGLNSGVPVYEFLEFLNLGAERTLAAKSVMRIEKAYSATPSENAYTNAGTPPAECTT